MAMTRLTRWGRTAATAGAMLVAGASWAGGEARFGPAPPVDISFVKFQSPDLSKAPGTLLTIQGKLSVPGNAAAPPDGTGRQGKRRSPPC